LKDNKPLDDLLEKVPDEFNDWVKSEVANFKEMYMITLTMAELTFIKFIKPEMSRKEAAEIIKTKDKGIQPILFKKLDNKDYSDLIWKKLYPSYSKPFKKNNEES
jgi:RNA ligase